MFERLRKCMALGWSGLRVGMRMVADAAIDRSGATIIDYALLAGLVALAALQGLQVLEDAVGTMFDLIAVVFGQSMPSSP